ncbi:Hypothetical predicted protein [Lecanosticta acicola]|uniref:Heterokaryon incompatibility domain-containing protein n=1 Tax=Lecanosticta acicola TaxID=111012 RepID=A0AAI8YRB6_9PEZI|nr:Hypothetical predicted protein [Lecanosticta acicola]
MHEIYQKATRTIAWLGEGEDDGEFALGSGYAGRKALVEPHLVDGYDKEYETRGWTAVLALMKRPCWQRLWVMQGIALSSQPPRAMCGRTGIQWGTLTAALAHE